MPDLIDFLVVVLPTVIALLSVYVSIKLTKGEPHNAWWGVIIALGIGTSALTWVSQDNARKAHAAEVQTNAKNLSGIKDQLQKSELQRVADTKYLEGKVEVFSQFAPAVVKLAQATELNTRKTYEAKMLSNKELYDATMEAVRKLREFSRKRSIQSSQQSDQFMAMTRNLKTDEERQKAFQEEARIMTEQYYVTDSEFRSSVLPDAIYVRNELRRRKLQEPPPRPLFFSQEMIDSVFAGRLAGAYPELGAADYLEQMAKQLRLK